MGSLCDATSRSNPCQTMRNDFETNIVVKGSFDDLSRLLYSQHNKKLSQTKGNVHFKRKAI